MAGQIIKRSERVWLARVFLGRDIQSGKRLYANKTIHGTKRDAQEWLTDALRKRDLGQPVQQTAASTGAFLAQWLDTVAKTKVKPGTLQGYQSIVASHVLPAIGEKPLAKVTPMDIQALYNAMVAGEYAPKTVRYTNMILRQAFGQAVKWRLIAYNPCADVSLPRQARKEMQVLSPDQARRFKAAAIMEPNGLILVLALTTGMRPSEYAALKWGDLDIAGRSIRVTRSVERLPGGGWVFSDNKTPKSRRTIKLHSDVFAALIAARPSEADSEALIFPNQSGSPQDVKNLAHRLLARILKTAELPPIRLYDLRHTCSTLALAAGVPVKVVSEMLGHASAAMTLDVYSHVLPHMQDEAAARVEALLTGDSQSSWHTIGTQPS